MYIFLLLNAIMITYADTVINHNDFVNKLLIAREFANQTLNKLYNEWQINLYPKFLKSCYMHKSSWELMKLKYMYTILAANELLLENNNKQKDFIISFLGSSVAAGHDSYLNESYPLVVGDIMKTSLLKLNINLITRNVALGNNPCTPYDMCVRIFAGLDADIIHWEQTYNCHSDPSIMEQFVRQAMLIPTKPILVFSESSTATWNKEDCKDIDHQHILTPNEIQLLNSPTVKIISDLNKDEFKRAWQRTLVDITKIYSLAGIQTFTHESHSTYKCKGPYIPKWQEGAARWHPSVKSHRLRAAHHSYFWLLNYYDSINELLSYNNTTYDIVIKEIVRKLHNFYHHSYIHSSDILRRHHLHNLTNHMIQHRKLFNNTLIEQLNNEKLILPKQLYYSPVNDNVQCYTDYQPRSIQESSLKQKVLNGLNGWKTIIYEDLVDKKLVQKSKSKGYLDYKYLLYGNITSGPLSIDINVQSIGSILLCETPGIWGSLPKGFGDLWELGTKVYMSMNVTDKLSYKFDQNNAIHYEFEYKKEYEICMKSINNVDIGSHVLTVVPTNQTSVIIAWLLVP